MKIVRETKTAENSIYQQTYNKCDSETTQWAGAENKQEQRGNDGCDVRVN